MNWDAIGAVAELLGAVGVIASLVYLATQIRHSQEQMSQNTRALRAGAYQRLHEDMSASVNTIPVPAMQLVRLGNEDFHGLSEEDAYLYTVWAANLVISFENAHYQYRTGMLDEDRWMLHRHGVQAYFSFPGFCQWWKSAAGVGVRNMLSSEFVALVEEILGEEAEGAGPTQ